MKANPETESQSRKKLDGLVNFSLFYFIMDILTLLALSLAPVAAIGLYIYWKDEHEREPIGLLIKSFFYGVLSTVITLIISWPISLLLPIDPSSLSQQAVHAFLLVALIEEFSK